MKEGYCCFTGHRDILPEDRARINCQLDSVIHSLIERGVHCFISGAAIGFDMLAAQAVLRAKRAAPAIRLFLALPCTDQDAKWSAAQRRTYQQLLSAADAYRYISPVPYYNGCMQHRNRFMVDHSGYVVVYLRRMRGGTFQTVNYARQQQVQCIYL